MFPRKAKKRQGAKALCLVLVFALLLPLSACAEKAWTPEDFVFGEDFEGFPEGHPPAALYLQVSGVSAYMADRESILPPDAADLVDLIYLAFARFDGEGISFPAVPEELRTLQEAGVSLLLSFSANAGDSAAHLGEIARDPERLETFAATLIQGVRDLGLDGVDLDWEATASGAGPDAAGMSALVTALRQAGGEDFLLSCAVPCSVWGLSEERFDLPFLAGTVDYFNLMSYDLGKKDRATHVSPLWPSGEDGGFAIGATTGTAILLHSGVKPTQILLGCAAYGKAYRTTGQAALGNPGRRIKLDLPGCYDTGTVQGKGLEALLADPAWEEKTETGARGFVGSYLVRDDLFVTYDSSAAYAEKYDFACRAGCGLVLWSLTQDTSDRFLSVLRAKNNA